MVVKGVVSPWLGGFNLSILCRLKSTTTVYSVNSLNNLKYSVKVYFNKCSMCFANQCSRYLPINFWKIGVNRREESGLVAESDEQDLAKCCGAIERLQFQVRMMSRWLPALWVGWVWTHLRSNEVRSVGKSAAWCLSRWMSPRLI